VQSRAGSISNGDRPLTLKVKDLADSAFCDINDGRVKLSHNQAVDIIAGYFLPIMEENEELKKQNDKIK